MLVHGELPAMKEAEEQPSATWWKAPARQWTLLLQEREEQVFLVLTLLIGALVGAIVVAFILLTERFGAHCTPRVRGNYDEMLRSNNCNCSHAHIQRVIIVEELEI